MREVVLDTETTGLSPNQGHRIVEVGAVELIDHVPTGVVYHQYINPERDMPRGAFDVHGLSEEFLQDHPTFEEIAPRFRDFVGDAVLVIHNAPFDMAFINAELSRIDWEPIPSKQVLDTLALARRKHPGQPNGLDALCRRYEIDDSDRTRHGALLDAELLTAVYLELIGERRHGRATASTRPRTVGGKKARGHTKGQPRPKPSSSGFTDEEREEFLREKRSSESRNDSSDAKTIGCTVILMIGIALGLVTYIFGGSSADPLLPP